MRRLHLAVRGGFNISPMFFRQLQLFLALLCTPVALACTSFTPAGEPVERGLLNGGAGGTGSNPECAGALDACGVCDGSGESTWYADTDGDSLGDPSGAQLACEQPDGYVPNADDTDPTCSESLSRDECDVCDGPGKSTWYADTDGDSLGDPNDAQLACAQPNGYVSNANDTDPTCSESLSRDECGVCDGPGKSTWYADTDRDGLGDPNDTQLACSGPLGYVTNADDTDPTCSESLSRDECGVCDGPGRSTWYADTDRDGLGDPNDTQLGCSAPTGYVGNSDDTDPTCSANVGRDACNVCGGPKTECVAPRVVGTTPGNGASDVTDEAITVTFSEPMNKSSVEAAFWPAASFSWSNNDATVTALIDGGLPFALGTRTDFDFGLNNSATDQQGNALESPLSVSVSLAQIRRAEFFVGWVLHQSGDNRGYQWLLTGDTGGGSPTHCGVAFDASSLPPYSSISRVVSAQLLGTVESTVGSTPGNIVIVVDHFNHRRDHTSLFDSSLLVTELGSISFGGEAPAEFDTIELDVTDGFADFWADPTRPDTDFSIRLRPRWVINNGSDEYIRFKRWDDVDTPQPLPASDYTDEAFRIVVDYL